MLAGTRYREDLSFHLSESGKLLAIEYRTPYSSAEQCEIYQKVMLHRCVVFASRSCLIWEGDVSSVEHAGYQDYELWHRDQGTEWTNVCVCFALFSYR